MFNRKEIQALKDGVEALELRVEALEVRVKKLGDLTSRYCQKVEELYAEYKKRERQAEVEVVAPKPKPRRRPRRSNGKENPKATE